MTINTQFPVSRIITEDFTTDFYLRLVNAVRLKELAVEFGYEIPQDCIESINSLAWRFGLVEFQGSQVIPDKRISIDDDDMSMLDLAMLKLNTMGPLSGGAMNGATLPMLYAFLSRPRIQELPIEEQKEDIKKKQYNARFFLALIGFLLIDLWVLPALQSWTGPVLLGAVEMMILVWLPYARLPEWIQNLPNPQG